MNSRHTVTGGEKGEKNLVKQQTLIDSNDHSKPELKIKPNKNLNVPIRKGEYLHSSLPATSEGLTVSRSRRRPRHRRKGNAANTPHTTDVIKGTDDVQKIPSNLPTETNYINPNSLRPYRIPKRRRINSNDEQKVNDSATVVRLEEAVGSEPPKTRPRPHDYEQEKGSLSFSKDEHTCKHPLPAPTSVADLKNVDKSTQNRKRNHIAKEELHNTPDVKTDNIESTNKAESDSYKNKTLSRVLKAKKSEPRCAVLATTPVVKSILKSEATLHLKYNDKAIQKTTTPADSIRIKQHGASSQSSCSSIRNKDAFDVAVETQNLSEMARKDFGNPCAQVMDMVAATSYSFPCDLDAMDVDILPTLRKQQLVVIVDTNVWLENQDSLNKLLNLEYQPGTRPYLIIPWMVLQEIDFNIHRGKTSSKVQQFRSASKFINNLLSSKTPNVKGEKAAEAIIGMEFNELMADDSILNCAIQYNKISQYVTVFITNDVNLLNKALVHDIASFKPDKELLNNVKQLFSETTVNNTAVEHNHAQIGSFSSPSVSTSAHETPFYSKEDEIFMDIDDPMDGNCSEIPQTQSTTVETNAASPSFEDVVDSVKKALTNIIVPKMVLDYGEDGWKTALKILPPYTVESGLNCLKAHWIAVFQFFFEDKKGRVQAVLDELLKVFLNKPNPDGVNEWRITVCKMTLVLLSMKDFVRRRQRVSTACNILQSYLKNKM
ncbi:unnamed protein product [Orchesella dallaii]|uniref:PIN domain-containing protein n=1 Tax=Orchesella dallaii TaxID=48710 RepID=A0ABP1QRI6_9HEXA